MTVQLMNNNKRFNTDDKKIQASFQGGTTKKVLDRLVIAGGGAILPLNEELAMGEKIPEGAIILDAYVKINGTTGATGQLSMGLRSHKDLAGATIAEDDNSLVNVSDSGGQSALKRSDNTSVAIGEQVGVGGASVFLKVVEVQASIPAGGLIIDAMVEYLLP